MKPIDLMVFDFDGTLVQSGEDIASSVNRTLRGLGLQPLERERIIRFVGDGVNKLIERSLGAAHRDLFDRALSMFRDVYGKHLLDSTGLYPGVREVLEHFREKRKVILTNKSHVFTMRIAEALDLKGHFDDIIAGDSTPYVKPDPRLIRPLMERFRANPDRTAVIGDGPQDVLLARSAGALSCAFLNGLAPRTDLLALEPDLTCERLDELKTFFA
ncbi:MAG TPA: HAD-IA family hydrolase [Syntrophales bacterium]|nr:HAD-IA family hydrolase [Syntrophales bacterium]HRT61324.1 HAD-IA family hydrolase [Syntrophales bacterium]